MSLKFAPGYPINNNSTLVWVMAWRRTLPKPMMTHFFTSIDLYPSLGLSESNMIMNGKLQTFKVVCLFLWLIRCVARILFQMFSHVCANSITLIDRCQYLSSRELLHHSNWVIYHNCQRFITQKHNRYTRHKIFIRGREFLSNLIIKFNNIR